MHSSINTSKNTKNMLTRKIAIIGAGNLGSSMARGLIEKNATDPKNLILTNIDLDILKQLKEELHVQVTSDNREAVREADLIFISVKPWIANDILEEIKPELNPDKHLVISAVSGLTIQQIKELIGDIPTARAMPNTAMSVNESMTAICFDGNEGTYKQDVLDIFSYLGESFVIPENQMAAATVLASCGIAYALRFMRAAATGGIEIGFNSELSHQIAAQIMFGAAKLIKTTRHHPEREIDKVTTPMGVTISGLNEMEQKGFSASVVQGVRKSFKKIHEALEED